MRTCTISRWLAVLVVSTTYGSNAGSQLPSSKIASSQSDRVCEQAEATAPNVMIDGVPADRPITETVEVEGRKLSFRLLHEELQLTYVHGMIDADEVAALVHMAEKRGGFIRSPLRKQGGGDISEDDRRNSSSCPMIWPLVYRDKWESLASNPDVLAELELATKISSRVAAMFAASGVDVNIEFIEPLQLVRYQASERFGPHHDYHATGESSVQGEQRAFTFLLFGSTLPPGQGGETHFPHLGVSVSPTLGDGLVWANVDGEGEPNERSLHEGRPPLTGEKIAINVWIADQAFSVGKGMSAAVVT